MDLLEIGKLRVKQPRKEARQQLRGIYKYTTCPSQDTKHHARIARELKTRQLYSCSIAEAKERAKSATHAYEKTWSITGITQCKFWKPHFVGGAEASHNLTAFQVELSMPT